VRVDYADSLLDRAAMENMADARLDEVSELAKEQFERFVRDRWAFIRIVGDEDPAALEGMDSERLQRYDRSRSLEILPYFRAMFSFSVPWCIAPLPTPAWAKSVFAASDRPAPADPEDALWKELAPILRLDAVDPAARWLADVAGLEARAQALNARHFDALRFTGPGTDLHIGLAPASRWANAYGTTSDGIRFTPNLPSEEVFSTPDARLTSGTVTLTKPAKILGLVVEGGWLRFERGEVVESGASRNAEILSRYLGIDAGARRLGEAALVECDSPVARSGLTFGNALLDENAACHIALGSGIEETFEGAPGMDEAARQAAGFNNSIDHVDVMIGSAQVDVDGLDSEGRPAPVMRGGKFVLG
jgi:aminopeptidase